MYENVWSGEVEGCEISLSFNEKDGLFRYTAKKDGVITYKRHCADPMDAGLMDGPGVKWDGKTPLVPSASEIKFEGRFAPFHTLEDIVGGTWLSPPTGRVTERRWRSMSWRSACAESRGAMRATAR